MLISVDARKRWFASVEKQPEPGENLVLTIDQKIQYIAERELETAMEQTHAIAGTVIVENPHTGEILALANRPTFNPNDSREITPLRLLKNHAVSDIYEPGSTFKMVTLSAALEEKLTRPDEVFDCQMGSIVVNGLRIHDWQPHGDLSVADILAKSSDVGAIKVALRLGDDRLYKYIRAFGFGQQTGIELPGETRGLTKPVNRWSKVSIGAISMGQEIGISPLQLAAMVSTIANDGVWVPPRIVAGTTEPRNTPQTIAFHPAKRAARDLGADCGADEADDARRGAARHGRNAILEGYSSAGKTGTAQKVDPATARIRKTKYVASFAGFAPVNNPAIAVVVILDSPIVRTCTCKKADGLRRRSSSAWRSRCSNTCTCRTMSNCHRAARCCWLQRKVHDAGSGRRLARSAGRDVDVAAAEVPDSPSAGLSEQPEPPGAPADAGAVVPAALREREPEPESHGTFSANTAA